MLTFLTFLRFLIFLMVSLVLQHFIDLARGATPARSDQPCLFIVKRRMPPSIRLACLAMKRLAMACLAMGLETNQSINLVIVAATTCPKMVFSHVLYFNYFLISLGHAGANIFIFWDCVVNLILWHWDFWTLRWTLWYYDGQFGITTGTLALRRALWH